MLFYVHTIPIEQFSYVHEMLRILHNIYFCVIYFYFI
jgi:hypothetical protein